MTHWLRRVAAGNLATLILVSSLLFLAQVTAKATTLEDWLSGFESGENWFGEDYAYDITDEAACWALLQEPVTVLNVGERETVSPLVEPGGKKVNNNEYGGRIAGTTTAVHVLGKDENGWTLIEGMDDYDRLIRGYVRTKLLKTVTPNKNYGLIVDKLTQRLYVFVDGTLFSSCAISTGLASDDAPYNETASGEYLISSWVGPFETEEGLVCEKAIRFNNGDLFHQVPYLVLGDGTKRFSTYEAKLGTKASHGCIRVARYPNDDGLAIDWLWDNLKKNTKVIIWDDDGREYPYPEEDTPLYYNAKGGSRYHSTATCAGVKAEYHPLTGFLYHQVDSGSYAELEPCDYCTPVKRRAWIDDFNRARGFTVLDTATQSETATMHASGDTQADSSIHETTGGAVAHPAEVTIISAGES